MLRSSKVSVLVVLCACLLIVLGDIRFIIGSASYWVLWCIVICAGFFFSSCKFGRSVSKELFVYITGFILLLISFFLSGLANQDMYTIYQGVKIFFIAVAFFCVYANVCDLKCRDIYKVSRISIAVGLFVFLIAKYMFRDLYVELGDGRQGSHFAYPGVLWKTPVFFMGFVMAGMIYAAGNKVISLLTLFGGVYLLMADSSRTGFLMLSMITLLFVMLCSYLKPKVVILFSLMLAVILIGFFILHSGGFIYLASTQDPLVLDRLAAGDPTRTKMIADGVSNAIECLPFGCGFGTSTSIVEGANMVVHNAYLSSIGDLGILGFIGMTVLICSPVLLFLGKLIRYSIKSLENLTYSIAAFGGVLGYALLLMLHPFSTELSEWGIWILMVSLLSTFSDRMVTDANEVKVESLP